ncbi:hypothetical protein V865_002604 [Kwoniella europaea PYCC6329]|uniref:VWFA domain-containing protein n=1 Tax=Kwoniella europaea PYCC6329 TaxID=1423913 RepID=A0AAX4KET0_9TREE
MGPMLTSSNVYWAFANRGYVTDPEYVKAVIRNYVHFKAQRGKSKTEISMKLEYLEREFPQFAYAFRAIRQEYSLSPSRILPAPRVTSSSASNSNNLRRTQTATTPSRTSNTNTITRTHTTVGATTNRATTNNDDEPPPPPYQSQDPDPASTRILQESLAAEAELRGTVPGQTTSTAATHNSSPPTSAATQPRTAGSANAEVDDGPQRVPSDPELARIWEESQFEEAKRASLAWQVEQQELQEAMRLSLAESESRGEGSSSATAGPSNSHPISTIPENQSIGGTSSHGSDMRDLVEGMEDMIIPGSYNSVQPSTSTSTSDNQNDNQQLQNLLDEQSSSYTGQTPLTPQKTGFHIQSKNPFLSSNEKEQLQAMEQAALHNQSHPAPPDQLAQQHTPPSMAAGSSYAHYTLPSEPSQQLYTPPPGPPPNHLRIVTPTSPTSRPLPATPKDQFPWDGSSSPGNGNGTISSPISHNQPSLSSPIAESHNSLHQTLQGTPPSLPARRKSFVPPQGKEDALEMLKDFDTVFLVDDSTSMAGERWSEASQALMEVAEIAARYDENGVDIYFLNSKRVGKELKAAHEVEDLFRGLEPKGATPTGMRLESILREYMARLERSQTTSPMSNGSGSSDVSVKPMNLIVVTDGAPTDDPESVIISTAKRLDRGEYPLSQVGIQFLQIGNDSEAREALQELDDGLSAAHGVRDIVDTVLYNGEDMSAGLIIKTLLGGINRRLDRRSSA